MRVNITLPGVPNITVTLEVESMASGHVLDRLRDEGILWPTDSPAGILVRKVA